MLRRRHGRAAVATFCVLTASMTGLVVSPASAAASVSTDQADMAKLEQQIAEQGARAQSLVSRYNEVQAHVNAIDAQIARDESLVAADQRIEADAMAALRRLAIKAYVSGTGMDSTTLAMFSGTSSITAMLEQNQYVGAINTRLNDALTSLQMDQSRTRDAQSGLRSEQAQAEETLRQLSAAHDAATAAIAADEAKLTRIRAHLRTP